ncbi:sodium:calcium antiporter [Marinicauda pacifica]|jgi:cation:H+ antiporter|uniref:Calcium/sodium antiporter n=1 Tax=Marinicauda pacifica TaxID=1133559 RepID=A0A4S2HD43_9PROT|nr:calcium/sodium antiporter [Marinicauda pacifica]TGY93970.1 calcium/sodium antiporter [Marinicauda pacifica]GGE31804.1 sodium:calcium antiporter [Marinicauda pacifica]
MTLAVDIILVISGIAVLLLGGDFLVRGAVALANRAGISPLIVGLTVVAFGTSAPEMVVSAAAAISNAPGLAVGNIVGSNIANIFLVLGLPAILMPMATRAPGVGRNALIALAASVLFIALSWDRMLDLTDGLILGALIIVYVIYLAIGATRAKDDPVIAELTEAATVGDVPVSTGRMLFFLLVGIVALPIGANLIVEGASDIAALLGVSDAIIGLTIIAFGTSLPELATAAVAAMKRHSEVAIGNVIGSNIFNIFAVGGITGISAGLIRGGAPIAQEFFVLDFWVMLAAAVIAAVLVLTRRPIARVTGAVLFLGYCGYIAALAYTSLS